MSDKSERIAQLNDEFRKAAGTPQQTGLVFKTSNIASLPIVDQIKILELVRTFNTFSEANDPYGEHDFGRIEYNGDKIFWKIDYYDREGEHGSPDPSDPEQTTRAMTIMFAYEW